MFRIRRLIDRPWTDLPPRRIGGVPRGLGTPDHFVLIGPDEAPRLRIDLYFPDPSSSFVVDVRVLDAVVVLGFSELVVVVPFSDAPAETRRLRSYFIRFYEGDGYLLAASGADVTRIDDDGTIAWQSERLAIDGIVIERIADGVIHGSAALDPLERWLSFALAAKTGVILAGEGLTIE